MPKYFLTCVLLALLALESNNMYSRIFIWTSASDEANLAYYMRQHRQHLQHRTQQQQQHQQHHHKRSHRHERHEQHVDSGEDEDVQFAQQRYELLQRHLSRQREHQLNHQKHYQKSQQPSAMGQQSFGAMPRIWQHLENTDEHMLSDASESNEFSSRTLLESVPPLVAIPGTNTFGSSDEVDFFASSSSENESTERGHKRAQPTLRCPKCESQRKVEHISEEELTRLRIEFVKQQILEKLRLKERPNVSAIGLPKPIYEGTTIQHDDEQTKTKDLDDYYARTSKKFIFLERETYECQRLGPHPSICFSFKIDDADADGFDVNTAVLWIFKNKQINNTFHRSSMKEQQTIVVSEVQQQQLESKYLPKVKPIAIQSIDVHGEWMKIDIEWPIKSWFGNHDLSHLIHISCQSCETSSMDEMISVDKDYRPFIMIDTQNRRRVSRQKRSVNCTDGITECCREKLYISFDDIGWGDWIIQPRGYDAYFCRGKCGSLASVTQISSPHSSFLQKVISANKYNGKPLELIPCCTAKQYSSLQLVFMDSNNTATLKTFPNMVVESCGCR